MQNDTVKEELSKYITHMHDLFDRLSEKGTEKLNDKDKRILRTAIANKWLQDVFDELTTFFTIGDDSGIEQGFIVIKDMFDQLS